jgi:hypothetical protein
LSRKQALVSDHRSKGETAKFTAEIVLSTEQGELPTDEDVVRLIYDQMGGTLDDYTDLTCLTVKLIDRTGELD